MTKLFLAFFILFLFFAASAESATLYVDTGCTNATKTYNPSTRSCSTGAATSYNSLHNGFLAVSAGDTLLIRGGTYTVVIDTRPGFPEAAMNSGTFAQPITIAAYPGNCVTVGVRGPGGGCETVTINGSTTEAIIFTDGKHWLVFDGLTIDASNSYRGMIPDSNTVWKNSILCCGNKNVAIPGQGGFGGQISFSTSNIQVINSKIYDNGINSQSPFGFYGMGFYWQGYDGLIENNEFYNNGSYAFQIYCNYGAGECGSNGGSGNIIRYNYIHDNGVQQGNGAGGPVVEHPTPRAVPNQIYGNVFANNTGDGLQVGPNGSSTPDLVYNNTSYNNTFSGIRGGPVILKNNIVWANQVADLYVDTAQTSTGTNNLCANISTSGGGTFGAKPCPITSNPLFVNTSTQDYSLTSSSPAINQGVTSICASCGPGGTPVNAVSNGSNPDIGRYETATVASANTVDASNVDAQVQSAYAPFTAISGCTGLTLKVNSVSKSLAGCTLQGNATIRYTCSSPCMVSGDAIQVSHSQTSGIADTAGQKLMPWADFAVTNNLSGGGLFVFTSKHFRCRVWNKNLTTNTAQDWYTPEDANCQVQNYNGRIFIINAIDCTGADCSAIGFRHRFQVDGGPGWTVVSNSCTTNELCYDNTQNGGAVHGAQITSSLLTDPHSSYVTGGVNAQDSSFPVIDLAQNQTTDIGGSFALKNGLAVGTQICIQPILDNGTVITNDFTTCLNVVAPGVQVQ